MKPGLVIFDCDGVLVDSEWVASRVVAANLTALGWRDGLAAELLVALAAEVRPVAGARAVLERVSALGIAWRVASNSSDAEMAAKFARCGLADLTAGRAFAAARVGRPKPAPDVYLAAAADAGVLPAACVVLEDSPLGVAGAVAAGMPVYGFAQQGESAALLAAGARLVFKRLDELFGVIA